MIDFDNIVGFDWNEGNFTKNWIKHSVVWTECEEVFFNSPILYFEDSKHSTSEKRYYILGRTNQNRYLFLVFTVRANKIRVISA